ncbi:MAG: DUF58 domain-containing protein [Oscillospiraceae bacterium]|nr:DUF58 domain-containing protein [Oscillospiraceae bacterium]
MKYIKITWYLLMAVFLFAGLISGMREFFLLFIIMLFVVLSALVLNLWTAFSFSFIQELSNQPVVKGSTTHLKIGIYNDKPFPFTLMKILVETISPKELYELNFNLSPRSNIDYLVPFNCPYRGIYPVGMTIIDINDVFGLVKLRFDMRRISYYKKQRTKIYPEILELPYLPTRNTDSKYSGGVALRLSDDGDSYSDLRRYRPGDPLKRVHKTVSARKRELYVKSYDIPLETTILIAIDSSMLPGDSEQKRYLADLACSCAIALAEVSLRAGFTIEVTGVDLTRSLKRRGKRELLAALSNALAEMPFDGEGDFGTDLELVVNKAQGYKAAYIISASEIVPYAKSLLRLRNEGSHVCYIKIANPEVETGNEYSAAGINVIPINIGDDIRSVLTGEVK